MGAILSVVALLISYIFPAMPIITLVNHFISSALIAFFAFVLHGILSTMFVPVFAILDPILWVVGLIISFLYFPAWYTVVYCIAFAIEIAYFVYQWRIDHNNPWDRF